MSALFKILDDLHQRDCTFGTSFVGTCHTFIEANRVKAGDKITMGSPLGTIEKLTTGEIIPVLVLVDKEQYERLNKKQNK